MSGEAERYEWYVPGDPDARPARWREQLHAYDKERSDPYGFAWTVCGRESAGVWGMRTPDDMRIAWVAGELAYEVCRRCVKLVGDPLVSP